MDAWRIIVVVFAAGCVGGLTNAAVAGELRLPHTDPEARVYKPGWVGNVLVGGVAAVTAMAPTLRVSELFAALLTGVGGGRLLTGEVDRRLLEKGKAALTETGNKLADSVKGLAEGARQ